MRTRDLRGNLIVWKPSGQIVRASDNRPRSKLHAEARKIIYELFPTMQILEEVPIKPRGTTQYIDFYINQIKLAIEVHGQQHYKFNTMFHASAQDFLNQRKKDSDKKEWCEINNITYIELPYNKKVEEWIEIIQSR